MSRKDFKIECPMCEGIIIVDARNGKIIRHHEAGAEDDDTPDPALFDDAVHTVKKKTDDGESVFTDAFKKVKNRKKGLDKLFGEAKKKADEKGDEFDPKDRPEFWD